MRYSKEKINFNSGKTELLVLEHARFSAPDGFMHSDTFKEIFSWVHVHLAVHGVWSRHVCVILLQCKRIIKIKSESHSHGSHFEYVCGAITTVQIYYVIDVSNPLYYVVLSNSLSIILSSGICYVIDVSVPPYGIYVLPSHVHLLCYSTENFNKSRCHTLRLHSLNLKSESASRKLSYGRKMSKRSKKKSPKLFLRLENPEEVEINRATETPEDVSPSSIKSPGLSNSFYGMSVSSSIRYLDDISMEEISNANLLASSNRSKSNEAQAENNFADIREVPHVKMFRNDPRASKNYPSSSSSTPSELPLPSFAYENPATIRRSTSEIGFYHLGSSGIGSVMVGEAPVGVEADRRNDEEWQNDQDHGSKTSGRDRNNNEAAGDYHLSAGHDRAALESTPSEIEKDH